MIMEDTIQGPDINSIHTVFPDIVTNTEVGYIGEGGMVGVVNTGCNPTPQTWNINTRKLKWEPGTWEILLSQCYTDLQQSATIYSLRTGVDIPDFTDTDYMNIVIEVLERSIMDFWYRLFWFNDKDAKNVTNSGIITDDLDLKFFTIINGFWKQITTQVTANPSQRGATITEIPGHLTQLRSLLRTRPRSTSSRSCSVPRFCSVSSLTNSSSLPSRSTMPISSLLWTLAALNRLAWLC